MTALDELLALLDTTEWQSRFVAITRTDPDLADGDAVLHLLRANGVEIPAWFSFERLTTIDRALAERYLPVLFRWELAYGTERLAAADARRAAELFLAPLGPQTRFYATIHLSPELVTALEQQGPASYACTLGVFGSTLESGLFAVDPAGLVGGVDIGDED